MKINLPPGAGTPKNLEEMAEHAWYAGRKALESKMPLTSRDAEHAIFIVALDYLRNRFSVAQHPDLPESEREHMAELLEYIIDGAKLPSWLKEK